MTTVAEALAGLFRKVFFEVQGAGIPPALIGQPGPVVVGQPPPVGVPLPVPPAFPGTSVPPSQLAPNGQPCPVIWPPIGNLPGWLNIPPGQGSQPPIVVAPPSGSRSPALVFAVGTPLMPNDMIRMRAFGNAGTIPVQFYGRVQKANDDIEPFQFTLTTNALATVFTRVAPIGPGMLLSSAASVAPGAITNGTINAVAELGQLQGSTFVPHTLLYSGQVTETAPLSGGVSPTESNTESYGYYTGTAAVGSALARAITITPPTGKRIRFTYMFAPFTNSAVAAERGYSYTLSVAGNLIWANGPDIFLGASSFGTLYAGLEGLLDTAIPAAGNAVPLATRLSPDLIFSQPVTATALYFNGQAGDGFSSINVAWQEW